MARPDSGGDHGLMGIVINAVDHTGITVNDLERSVAFWTGVLGFELERRGRITGEFAAEVTGVGGADISTAVVAAPGHRIELLQYHAPEHPAATRTGPEVPGAMHLAFRVDDLDEVLAALDRAGWAPDGSAATMADGPRAGTRFVYLRDPDGTTLEFIQAPH